VQGGHSIVKVLIYLQDHSDDDDAITIVPGSHRSPELSKAGAKTLRLAKGSVIIFEQRATHRGRSPLDALRGALNPERVLVSLGYGRDNIYTDQFERGTRARQANQCGSRCQPTPADAAPLPPARGRAAAGGGGVAPRGAAQSASQNTDARHAGRRSRSAGGAVS